MRDRKTEFKVGLLVVTAMGLVAAFVFALGNFSLQEGYYLYVDYDFTGSLQPGAPVKVSGIKVGRVEEIQFHGGRMDERTGRRVQVRLKAWVEDRVRDTIREDAEFFVNTAGVLGEQYLEIVPGNYDRPALAPGSVAVGVDPPRTDLIVARLYEVLDSVSDLLRDDKDLIRDVLENGSKAVAELNLLLSDNREALGKLIVSANGLAGEATGAMADFRKGLGNPAVIGKTVRDADAFLVRARSSLDELTPKVSGLVDDAGRVTSLVDEQRVERVLTVADNAVRLTGKANQLVDSANEVVGEMKRGKGTVGSLLVRDEVYADVREMIRDLRRNPWKFFWKE